MFLIKNEIIILINFYLTYLLRTFGITMRISINMWYFNPIAIHSNNINEIYREYT